MSSSPAPARMSACHVLGPGIVESQKDPLSSLSHCPVLADNCHSLMIIKLQVRRRTIFTFSPTTLSCLLIQFNQTSGKVTSLLLGSGFQHRALAINWEPSCWLSKYPSPHLTTTASHFHQFLFRCTKILTVSKDLHRGLQSYIIWFTDARLS